MDRTRHPTYFLKAFDGEAVSELPVETVPGELFELEEQIRCVRDAVEVIGAGTAPPSIHCNGLDGRWAIAMCHGAQESIASGQRYVFPSS